ncbi:MAG: AI-2E family transporter [Ignavibacteria bacterium]|nr:AI-2E family transporter [Ignavibacteria bacterium]
MKETDPKLKIIALNTSLIVGIAGFIGFLYLTKQLFNPLIIFLIGIAIVFPLRKESYFARRLLLLFVIFFVFWIFSVIGSSIAPFVISFLFAYLLDPLVRQLQKNRIPRWLSSLAIILLLVGIVTLIFVLISPLVFQQLNDISQKIATVFTEVTKYLEVQRITQTLEALGIRSEYLNKIIETEVLPELKFLLSQIISSLRTLLTGLSSLAKQAINAILIPIFSFYFLKDFDKIIVFFQSILEKKNPKLLEDLFRINDIFRIYVSWQVFAAFMVGSFCSLSFWLFKIEFSIILGILCGFLNPIPYLGLISSLLISILTILLVAPANTLYQIVVVASTISLIHFINAYFIEPNILGKRVGLHPLLLFLSLFIFGGLFGLLGLLIAVPTTATLMLFLNDWVERLETKTQ